MKAAVLLDTGPLVTFLAAGLKHHAWVCEQWRRLRPPLVACEPALTEAAFLLEREGREADPICSPLSVASARARVTAFPEHRHP